MAQHSKTHSGFSLIELLVVLVIIGVLSFTASSMFQSAVPGAVKASGSSLNGAIREAQTLALSSGQQVYLKTTGGGNVPPSLSWGFRILKADGTLDSLAPPKATWILGTEGRYVSVGVANANLTAAGTNPMPSSIGAITSHILDNATIWNRAFFSGSSSPTPDADCPFFLGTGAINQEFAVTVAGARSNIVLSTKNRLDLILVSPRSGITYYSKNDSSNAASPWSRQ